MKYWLTTHWPPREDRPPGEPAGIYIAARREADGKDIEPGDLVFIYESGRGRTVLLKHPSGDVRKVRHKPGRQAVIALARVTSRLEVDSDAIPQKYADGSEIFWRWKAETEFVAYGFVPRSELNRILGYKETYSLRAIGSRQSGVMPLTEAQFSALLYVFRNGRRTDGALSKVLQERSKLPPRPMDGPESPAHLHLKMYVASNPAEILGEAGLETAAVEYKFHTNDRADLVLTDAAGRFVGVEIEVEQGPRQFDGMLQAIKYRYMLAPMQGREFSETRGFLVAYRLAPEVESVCKRYQVECFTVDRARVEEWSRPGAVTACVATEQHRTIRASVNGRCRTPESSVASSVGHSSARDD